VYRTNTRSQGFAGIVTSSKLQLEAIFAPSGALTIGGNVVTIRDGNTPLEGQGGGH
jgi:hypothetical protein